MLWVRWVIRIIFLRIRVFYNLLVLSVELAVRFVEESLVLWGEVLGGG